ncbi:MAG: aminodeoxychorismate synthase component I [Deltaproteobacteria bacterium]|nr:aminodeoxychorismate synthase component I [Deltaproteobacteria bacterium]
MFIRSTDLPPSQIAGFLSRFDDFSWIDSADGRGFSIMAFNSSRQAVFSQQTPPQLFLQFLNNLPFGNIKPLKDHGLFFAGGWIGFLCYESFLFNPLIPFSPSRYKPYPLAALRYYDTFFYVDHENKTTRFVSLEPDAETKWVTLQKKISDYKPHFFLEDSPAPCVTSHFEANLSKEEYKKKFDHIKAAIFRGDYFELNFSIEFHTFFPQDPFLLYNTLRNITKSPMMSFLSFPGLKILSSSPERFFSIDGRDITTLPIKGTIARGSSPENDALNKTALLQSAKDRAELMMVTDMLRNDLGRICETGSVDTRQLAQIATFSHYHHLYSEITGTLKLDSSLQTVFQSLFPGGSITGAPKIQVMKHINQIEERARGVYTGAIGFISNNGKVDFNIPIRTITVCQDQISFATGGGIVADSGAEEEYHECLIKAAGIFEAIKGFGGQKNNRC